MADRIGSLEPGKRADIVVHDTSGPHWTPRSADPVLQLVWASDGRSVRDVVVDGRVVVRDGRCTTVDLDALRDAAARRRAGGCCAGPASIPVALAGTLTAHGLTIRPMLGSPSAGRSPAKDAMAYPNTLIFVDFPSNDPEATAQFYAEVFGWEVEGRPTGTFHRIVPGQNFMLPDSDQQSPIGNLHMGIYDVKDGRPNPKGAAGYPDTDLPPRSRSPRCTSSSPTTTPRTASSRPPSRAGATDLVA